MVSLRALGSSGGRFGGSSGIGCLGDLSRSTSQSTTTTNNVNLDENTVLLGIALHNAGGSPLSFWDLNSGSFDTKSVFTNDQTVSLNPHHALLWPALG